MTTSQVKMGDGECTPTIGADSSSDDGGELLDECDADDGEDETRTLIFNEEQQSQSNADYQEVLPPTRETNNKKGGSHNILCQHSMTLSFLFATVTIVIIALAITTTVHHDDSRGGQSTQSVWSHYFSEISESSVVDVDHDLQQNQLQVQLQPFPKVALLLSFPNSGTTYTLDNVRRVSHRRTATNYCLEGCDDTNPYYNVTQMQQMHNNNDNDTSRPQAQHPKTHGATSSLYDNTYSINNNINMHDAVVHPNLMACDSNLEIPSISADAYILTKTHCSGYCHGCKVTGINGNKQFDTSCRLVHGCAAGYDNTNANNAKGEGEREETMALLSPLHIGKIVHLLRCPFDNLVARFHFRYSRHTIHNHNISHNHADNEEQSTSSSYYALNATGFRQYCANYVDVDAKKELDIDSNSNIIGDAKAEAVAAAAVHVPCAADFVQYVQWHNHANAFIQTHTINFVDQEVHEYHEQESSDHPVADAANRTVMTLHYHEYHDDWNATTQKILNFLHLRARVPNNNHNPQHSKNAYVDNNSIVPVASASADSFHWSDYTSQDYFTLEERVAAKQLVQALASNTTWKQLEPYFPSD
jgi:hypothetical protein